MLRRDNEKDNLPRSFDVGAGGASLARSGAITAIVGVPCEMKRVVLARLKYNTDLLEGLRQAVKNEKIKNAVILSGVGSVPLIVTLSGRPPLIRGSGVGFTCRSSLDGKSAIRKK